MIMTDKERALNMKLLEDKFIKAVVKKVFDTLNNEEAMTQYTKIKWIKAPGWKNTSLQEVQHQEVTLTCKCCGEKTIKAILPGCPPEFCAVCEKAYVEYRTKGVCRK